MKERAKVLIETILLVVLIAFTLTFAINLILTRKDESNLIANLDPELQRAMTYEKFEDGDENVEGTDNVKFSAFFLRDLDGDGYAEKVKGTCKEIGSRDTLYMEIIVQSEGYLKNGKIQIDGKNFYLKTGLPKDNELKDNYISYNTRVMEFDILNNGLQKLLIGEVLSGNYTYEQTMASAIGDNVNNYSRDDNKITLSGIYVDANGVETEIIKEIELSMDWYGKTVASLYLNNQTKEDLVDRINEEEETLTLDFHIEPRETAKELQIYSNYIEGTIPDLNGYNPISVRLKNSNDLFIYNEITRNFTIRTFAEINENGELTKSINRWADYIVEIVYPLEAYYSSDSEAVSIRIPLSTYYEGYNNPNEEFRNPYKSNIARGTIAYTYMPAIPKQLEYSVIVGRRVSSPYSHSMISKRKPLKIYNNVSAEETDDIYNVKWVFSSGDNENINSLTFAEPKNEGITQSDSFVNTNTEEDSMENITSNIGIYFYNAEGFLGEDGEIKVYDDDTDILIKTFTSADWNKYTSSKPYLYDYAVKHVRVVTSHVIANKKIEIIHIKELDDDKIVDTYNREEFDNLCYIKSRLEVYRDGNKLGEKYNSAIYEEPYSIASISINRNIISTQRTEKNLNITIQTIDNLIDNIEKWENGLFLIKIPDEILDIKINSVDIYSVDVEIDSYEIIKNEQGKFIKIKTSNSNPASYYITIDADITPDPRIPTTTQNFELYAINEGADNYYYSGSDTYDLDGDSNITEKVNVDSVSINMVSPNSLITNQTISEYNDEGTIVISPEIAELKPIYSEDDYEKQTVKIGAQIRNNYSGTISEIMMIGKIPFEGNTYVLSQENLNSEFTTNMKSSGIEIPSVLEGKIKVYYSEKENPDRDISDPSNGWKLKEDVSDWSKIKTWAVDFCDVVMGRGAQYTFYYVVEIPYDAEYNQIAYSHHAIEFCLDTAEGKYKTQTEPNKIGVMIADKYNLVLTKYQKDKDRLIQGATYKITKLSNNGEIEESQTAVTNSNGLLEMANLYAEKIYEIKEIQSPTDYDLNDNAIYIIGHINRTTGILTIEKLLGEIKGDIQVIKNEDENYKIYAAVEDEAKASIKLIKYEKNTDNKIKGAKYRIYGAGFPSNGKTVSTKANGELRIQGLKIGIEYRLDEVKAPSGFYINSKPIYLTVLNDSGSYKLQIRDGGITTIVNGTIANYPEIKNATIVEENDLPIVSMEIEDELIPKYNMEITKIRQESSVTSTETEYIAGAKFKLYKDKKEIGTYTTDENGKINIENLYQYNEDKNIDQTYVLKEIYVPEGYTAVKDITFRVYEQENSLVFDEIDDDEQTKKEYTAEGNTIKLTVEDSPVFKLVKRDEETNLPLSGVKFSIYDVENSIQPARNSKGEIIGTKETINGKDYYIVETDLNGEITADLPEGSYKIEEVVAPDIKYDITGETYYFTIGTSTELRSKMYERYIKGFGGINEDKVNDIKKVDSNNYIVVGSFNSPSMVADNTMIDNNGEFDGYVIKFDMNGNIIWKKIIGGSGNEEITAVEMTEDGGLIVVGSYDSDDLEINGITYNAGGKKNGLVIKYTSSGEVEWVYSTSKSADDYFNMIKNVDGNRYIVTGKYETGRRVGEDLEVNVYCTQIVILEDDATIIKEDVIESNDNVNIYEIKVIDTDIYLRGDHRSSINKNGVNIPSVGSAGFYSNRYSVTGCIIKLNYSGELQWGYNCGTSGVFDVTSDGGCLVGTTLTDKYLIKYSTDGEEEWINTNITEKPAGIVALDDDEYIIAVGMTLLKYNYDGELLFTKAVENNGNGVSTIRLMYLLTDNSFVLETDKRVINYDVEGEKNWEYNIDNVFTKTNVIKMTDDKYLIAGMHNKKVHLDDGTLVQNNGGNDILIYSISEETIDSIDCIAKNGYEITGTNDVVVNSVVESPSGGYIVGGNSNKDAFVRKYNENNKLLWSKNIVGIDSDQICKIIRTSDGQYVAVGELSRGTVNLGNGNTLYNNFQYPIAIIFKFDDDGNVIWAKYMRSLAQTSYYHNYGRFNSVIETSDGGYLAVGYFDDKIDLGNGIIIEELNNWFFTGMAVKFDANGNTEWGNTIGNYAEDVCEDRNGNYIVGGYFESVYLDIDDGTRIKNSRNNFPEAFVALLNKDGRSIKGMSLLGRDEGGSSESVKSVVKTCDDGFIIGGYYNSSVVNFGNGITLSATSSSKPAAFIAKYDKDWNAQWAKGIAKGGINEIIATKEDKYMAVGYFSNAGETYLGNGQCFTSGENGNEGMIVIYDINGAYQGGTLVGGNNDDQLITIIEKSDGKYLAGGYYKSNSIILKENTLTNASNYNVGMLLNLKININSASKVELLINNIRKQFKITTSIKEIDGNKGGSISGEDLAAYETVKYGDNSNSIIKMTPMDDYEIIGLTVNGVDYDFVPDADGSFTMPQFENITEDIHVEVSFALSNNKITINKKDSVTGNNIEGATFKLDQLEEREEPVTGNLLGEMVTNSMTYYYADLDREVTGMLGELTNNAEYYFVEDENGSLVPTNSKTWQVANVEGATTGVHNSTAHSYIPIDLTGLSGKYKVIVNAEVSSQSYDYGFARITTSTSALEYSSTNGRFIYISNDKDAQDYESNYVLEGGSKYYLHLGYYKNGNTDTGNDQIKFNSIKLYEAAPREFGFVEEDGKYVSTNIGYDNTTCNSYIPLDLSGLTGKYYITVNAQVSSQSYDYGYVTLKTNTSRVDHSTTYNVTRMVHISGTDNTPKDYTTEVDGGRIYYLHLGYYKDANTSSGDDKFIVNSIIVTTSGSELYHTVVETDSNGQAITQIPFGKYAITEMIAPEGYYLNDSIPDIEFRENGIHEISVEDEKIAKVIVHHYKKGTTEKIAEDEIINGSIGGDYETSPKLDSPRFRLEEINGEYVLPDNITGTYTYDDIEVNYYYVPREIPLVVHHYLEGTNSGVPLIDGTRAGDVITEGNENDTYTTEAINSNLLDPKYELVEVPENSTGTLKYDQVIVTYYYRVKDSLGYVVHHVNIENGEKIAEDEIESGGKYGDYYETYPSSKVPENYSYDSRTDNWEGTLVDTVTEVTYYYRATTELKTLEVEKTSTTTIVTDKNQVVSYKISYSGLIDEYVGKAKIRIIDNLPYEIDESLSNLNGGTYDSTNRTITWENNYIGIDTYVNGIYTINIVKNISVVYKDIDLSAVKITNSISGNLITYDGTTEHERLATDDIDIPQEIKGKVIVKYLDKKTNEEISEDVIHSARIGTDFDVSDDVKEIEGYVLKEEPQEKIGIYTEVDQVRTYKYSKKINYTVEYYYSGIKDDSRTDTITGVEDSTINSCEQKEKDGYRYDRVENLPLLIDRDGNNVIKVYYEKDSFGYRIEYYYDDIIDNSKTETGTAEFESKVETYEDKNVEGYKLKEVKNLPLTITSNSDNNVIKVYYEKDNFEYTVEYYFSGVKDDTLTETNTAEFGSKIEDYIDKVKTGYILSRTENLPLIIKSNPTQNIIKIFYIPDDGQTKEIFYNIEYYKDEQIVTEDTKKITNTVQLLDPETLEVNIVEVYEQDKYEGYIIDRTEPENIPNTINSGSTIKVFYKKRNDITYQILFKEKGTGRVIAESEGGTGTYQDIVKAEDYITDIQGYIYDSCDKDEITLSAIDDENVITLYYRKRNDLSYTVHYLEKDTDEELKTEKVVNNQTFGDEILSEDEVIDIDGYEYDSSNVDSIIIREDVSLNNINLYYKKRSDLSYTVKYVDKDTNKEIAERKTVNNRTYGEVIDTTSEIIDIAKYNYESISSDTITIGTNDNEIIVYYTKKEGTLIVRFIDQISGEEISERVTATEKVDTEYRVEEKDIDGYVYIESSGNKEGIFTETPQEVILYYRKAAKVIVRYVDISTNEEIEDSRIISGFIGKEYSLEDKGKEIAGYRYSDRTDNISGGMTEEDIEVIYYYKKESKVIVKYINAYTNEVIEIEEKTYLEEDTYSAKPKTIEGYDLDENKKPGNEDGTVGREDIEVKYYYREKATLIIEYVDEKGNKIVNDKEKDVHIGEDYEVDKVLIDGYNFRGMPNNYKGTIENKRTVVRLVYDKIYSDDSKADTTIPQTMDKNIRKGLIISGMIAVLIYSIVVIIRWKISENKNK